VPGAGEEGAYVGRLELCVGEREGWEEVEEKCEGGKVAHPENNLRWG